MWVFAGFSEPHSDLKNTAQICVLLKEVKLCLKPKQVFNFCFEFEIWKSEVFLLKIQNQEAPSCRNMPDLVEKSTKYA